MTFENLNTDSKNYDNSEPGQQLVEQEVQQIAEFIDDKMTNVVGLFERSISIKAQIDHLLETKETHWRATAIQLRRNLNNIDKELVDISTEIDLAKLSLDGVIDRYSADSEE